MCFHEFRNTESDRLETMYVLTAIAIVIVSVLFLGACSSADAASHNWRRTAVAWTAPGMLDDEPLSTEPMVDEASAIEPATLAHQSQHVIDALGEASWLHSEMRTDEAIELLAFELRETGEPALLTMHQTLRAERLLQLGVEAEQAGRFEEARQMYLRALAIGGDRQALSERIDAVTTLVPLERELQRAESQVHVLNVELHRALADADELRQELNVRDHLARSLRGQLHDNEHELRTLRREHDRFEDELKIAVRTNRTLEREIDELRRQLRDAQEEARRARLSERQNQPGGSSRPRGQRP